MGTSVLSRRIDRRVRIRSAASTPAVAAPDVSVDPAPGSADATRALADPAPWSAAQARALGRAVGRECGWGLRLVHDEVAAWQARAARIPHSEARAHALHALSHKRSYLDGAALFWTLPQRRDPRLLSLLVRFQIAADFLDQASEQGVAARGRSGGSLMRAFVDAIDPAAPPAGGYYADHPWADDGGYLDDLVAACRETCAALPGHPSARELLVREARRARALELVHEPDVVRRDRELRRLAAEESDRPATFVGSDARGAVGRDVSDRRLTGRDAAGRDVLAREAAGRGEAGRGAAGRDAAGRDAAGRDAAGRDAISDPWWFETTAGGASALTVIVLLALAADPATTDRDRVAAARAYRWVGALSTVLDGYVDQLEDRVSGGWSSVGHYRDADVATERIGALIDRTLREVGALKHGERHLVIVGSMIALFLSRNSARSAELAPSTRELIASGGTLTRRLVPVLRLWRTAFGQRSA